MFFKTHLIVLFCCNKLWNKVATMLFLFSENEDWKTLIMLRSNLNHDSVHCLFLNVFKRIFLYSLDTIQYCFLPAAPLTVSKWTPSQNQALHHSQYATHQHEWLMFWHSAVYCGCCRVLPFLSRSEYHSPFYVFTNTPLSNTVANMSHIQCQVVIFLLTVIDCSWSLHWEVVFHKAWSHILYGPWCQANGPPCGALGGVWLNITRLLCVSVWMAPQVKDQGKK